MKTAESIRSAQRRTFRFALGLAAAAALAACADMSGIGPAGHLDGLSTSLPADVAERRDGVPLAVNPDWWRDRGDEQLVDGIDPPSLAAFAMPAVPSEIPLQPAACRAAVAALSRVEAAQHDVKSAKAQFYPNVNLVAFAGTKSVGLGGLLHAGTLQWG